MTKTRARRRHEDQLRRGRIARRRARRVWLGVVDQRPPERSFVVTLPLEVTDTRRGQIRDGFLAAAGRMRGLDLTVEAKVTDAGITITMGGIVARSPESAKSSAVYWCERIAKSSRWIAWTGKGVQDIEVRDG